jgi:hypothetical protein
MATYTELLFANEDPDLKLKIKVACVVAAEQVRTEATSVTNHASRVVWAKKVFENPDAESSRMTWAVLAQNRASSLASILSATDSAVQTAVDAAINVFAS